MMEPSLHQAFSSGDADVGKRFEQLYIAVEQSPVATAITDAGGQSNSLISASSTSPAMPATNCWARPRR